MGNLGLEEHERKERKKGGRRTAPARKRPLVLVVDDDADLRSVATMHLGTGFDVLEASSGRECVDMARTERPDVILLDMMMPGMDGREVLTELAAENATKDIPVIFLSAVSAIESKVEAIESGAVDYVTKPADWREVSARVGVAARKSPVPTETEADVDPDPRTMFEARLEEEASRSMRNSSPLSLLIIEVDEHETYRLRHGDQEAEKLMGDLKTVLNKALRAADALFANESQGFHCILPDTDVATAFLAAERLRRDVLASRSEAKPVTVSIGIGELSNSHSATDLVAKAQVALFRAKESGGNLSWRGDDPRKHGINPLSLSEELTEREWDVLTQLAQRCTEQEIGRRLGISAGTVRSHKARIRRKLHVAPDVRLSEFVKSHLGDLADGLVRTREAD